jgi:diacylglycerol kinase (ATP)
VRIAVLINPISGFRATPETGRRRAEEAVHVLGRGGFEVEALLSERPGHLFELAQSAVSRGLDRVIAWGGDGTVNEVASALVFTPVALGVVPAGSGNGLARALAISTRADRALARAAIAPVRCIDAGEIAGRLFFNIAGVGFDAHVAHAFSRHGGRRGLRQYATIVTRELLTYSPRQYRVRIDDDTRQCRAFLLSIANGPQWGNGAAIAPDAVLDDGLFDVVVAETTSMLQVGLKIPRLFTGTIGRARGVSIRRGRSVEIAGDEPLCVHVDGEAVASDATIVEARLHPRALRVCA